MNNLLIILALLSGLLPGKASSTAFRTDSYPRILEDNSVVFSLYAPDAHSVKVILPMSGVFPMEKDGSGFWTGTVSPQAPGFHYYMFDVDGAEVNDPAVRSFRGYGKEVSAIEIPVPDSEWMEYADVPHGRVCERVYRSCVTGEYRTMCVYTPPGYEKNPLKRYPVVYIGHGSGEDNRSWMEQGRVPQILDNLIASGEAVPMIAVSMDSQLYDDLAPYTPEGMEPFSREFLGSIIPFVDSEYRTLVRPSARAMCGLSQGAGESFVIGMSHPELFSYIGIFSCGLFGRMYKAGRHVDFDSSQLRLVYLTCGRDDNRVPDYETLVRELTEQNQRFEYELFDGDHEWQPWRESFRNFAGKIF